MIDVYTNCPNSNYFWSNNFGRQNYLLFSSFHAARVNVSGNTEIIEEWIMTYVFKFDAFARPLSDMMTDAYFHTILLTISVFQKLTFRLFIFLQLCINIYHLIIYKCDKITHFRQILISHNEFCDFLGFNPILIYFTQNLEGHFWFNVMSQTSGFIRWGFVKKKNHVENIFTDFWHENENCDNLLCGFLKLLAKSLHLCDKTKCVPKDLIKIIWKYVYESTIWTFFILFIFQISI